MPNVNLLLTFDYYTSNIWSPSNMYLFIFSRHNNLNNFPSNVFYCEHCYCRTFTHETTTSISTINQYSTAMNRTIATTSKFSGFTFVQSNAENNDNRVLSNRNLILFSSIHDFIQFLFQKFCIFFCFFYYGSKIIDSYHTRFHIR